MRSLTVATLERRRQTQIRKAHGLPYRCECGGIIAYDYEFERVWSYCKRCTPGVIVKQKRRA